MHKSAKIVHKHDAKSAARNEAVRGANGGIGNDAIIFSWTDQKVGIAATNAGYDVVMCSAQNVYLNMAHSVNQDDWGTTWASIISLEDTLDWNPVPSDDPGIANRIIGMQGIFCSEFTQHDSHLDGMLTPRALGKPTKSWETDQHSTGADLRPLAGHFRKVFEALGWHWNQNAEERFNKTL
jgi:hexosaminidase